MRGRGGHSSKRERFFVAWKMMKNDIWKMETWADVKGGKQVDKGTNESNWRRKEEQGENKERQTKRM